MPEIILACEVAVMPNSLTHFINFCRSFKSTPGGAFRLFVACRYSVSLSTSRKYASTELSLSDRSSCKYALKPFLYGSHISIADFLITDLRLKLKLQTANYKFIFYVPGISIAAHLLLHRTLILQQFYSAF